MNGKQHFQYQQRRSDAISWWNGLTEFQKAWICTEHHDLISVYRHWSVITVDEIEQLYLRAKEVSERAKNDAVMATIDPDEWSK